MLKGYADLGDLNEDARIDVIGKAVTEQRQVVGFVVDSEVGKADRYILKLSQRYPEVKVLERFNGPVPNTVTIKVGPSMGKTKGKVDT